MSGSAETFSLLAEIAVAIAGFGGVAAAFGGRDRVFNPTERMRLLGIFVASGTVLFGCLLWAAASEAGLSETAIRRLVSMGMVGCVLVLMLPPLPATFRHARDPDSTSAPSVLALTALYTTTLLCAYLVNALWLASSWLLVAAFSLQLIFGLWMFFRLLTRPN